MRQRLPSPRRSIRRVFELAHWFEVERVDGGTMLRHAVDGEALEKYVTIWRERVEPTHDRGWNDTAGAGLAWFEGANLSVPERRDAEVHDD